jgi:hypothetical protein
VKTVLLSLSSLFAGFCGEVCHNLSSSCDFGLIYFSGRWIFFGLLLAVDELAENLLKSFQDCYGLEGVGGCAWTT